jgi:hypothetical protein
LKRWISSVSVVAVTVASAMVVAQVPQRELPPPGIPMALAQQGPALPFAGLSGRTVTLQPSGATLQIPDAVLLASRTRSRGRVAQFTWYLSRPDLERVRGALPTNGWDEWDGPYSSILNAVLPFDACAVHFGTEPFGSDGGSFFDLQVRVYVVDGPAQPIRDRIAADGLSHAKGKERFPDAAITTATPAGAWNVTTLGFTMNRADYRATSTRASSAGRRRCWCSCIRRARACRGRGASTKSSSRSRGRDDLRTSHNRRLGWAAGALRFRNP